MGRCAIDGADRVHRLFRLVLEDALLARVNPGHPGLPNAGARGNDDQPSVRERHLGVGIAIIEAHRDGGHGGSVGHVCWVLWFVRFDHVAGLPYPITLPRAAKGLLVVVACAHSVSTERPGAAQQSTVFVPYPSCQFGECHCRAACFALSGAPRNA